MPRTIDKDGVITDLPDGEQLTRSQVVAMLKTAFDAKEQREAGDTAYVLLMGTNKKPGPIREWFITFPDDILYDGETGIEAVPTEKSSPRDFDWRSFVRDYPDEALVMLTEGIFKFSFSAWNESDKNFSAAEIAKRYIMPGGTTLQVDIRKRGK